MVLNVGGVAVANLHRFSAYRDVYVDRIEAAFDGALWIVNAPGTTNPTSLLLADSFDTAGWFARDGEVFARVGEVLLGKDKNIDLMASIPIEADEIEELMNLGEKFALPVLLYLFRRIERALQGQPAVIILDEAWLMLGHPAFRAKIREWLKVLRKANCLVLMATQSLSDAANSGILDVIMESTATKMP